VRPALRTAACTAAALTGFAANSLLCRGALRPGLADAASFTSLRLLSGAAVLALLAGARPRALFAFGSWASAGALFAYAAAFSFAYLRIPAGAGALLMFGSVQTTMIAWALVTGERPPLVEWMGIVLAVAGLVALVWTGLGRTDLAFAALMVLAGVAWGTYSLRGRGAERPLATTAANFVRSAAFTVPLSLFAPGAPHVSARGALLACASGAVASGLGYTVWYAALPGLTATRAAVLQLAVPVLAAAGGVLLLGETVTLRLLAAGAAILGGVALAVLGRRPR